MSADQLRHMMRTSWGHTITAPTPSWDHTYLAADGRIIGIPAPGGGPRAIVVPDPSKSYGAFGTSLGSPSITNSDGNVVPWYDVNWLGHVNVPERDEVWGFYIIQSSTGAPIGFNWFTFWALVVDCASMTAITTDCGFTRSLHPDDPPGPVGPTNMVGYDPASQRIFLVHSDADFDQTPTKGTLTVNTINVNTRVLTIGTPQTLGDFPVSPSPVVGRLYPTGNYMVGASTAFGDAVTTRVNKSSKLVSYETVGISGTFGRAAVADGRAYFPPGNGATPYWLVADGAGFSLRSGGLSLSSAFGFSQAHVGPDGRLYAFPDSSHSSVLAYDADADVAEMLWSTTFTGAGGSSIASVMLPNGNMFAPVQGADDWKAVGLRPFPEAHGVPIIREPIRQYGPHVGAVVQPYQSGLDPAFALWVTANWDGGWYLLNEGTGGDAWDLPIIIDFWNLSPESHRMWAGWRHNTPIDTLDIETEFGGPLGGRDAKPVTTITAFGDYDQFFDFVYTYTEVLLRGPGGGADWTISRFEMEYNPDDNDLPGGFINYLRGSSSSWFANIPGEIGLGGPDLRGKLLVITHDVHLGGIQVWIDGESYPTTPINTDTDQTFPDGSEFESAQRYNVELVTDRAFFSALAAWGAWFLQIGQNSTIGPPVPGQPWSGLPLLAFARGEPTAEDLAYYYQLAYPGKTLPPGLGGPPAPPSPSIALRGSVSDAVNLDGALWVSASGTVAVVSATDDDRLTTVDISDPDNPVVLDSIQDATQLFVPQQSCIIGDHAFVAIPGSECRLTSVDISDPSNISIADSLQDFAAFSNAIYVSQFDSSHVLVAGNEITLVDVSDPTNMFVVRTWDPGAEGQDGLSGYSEQYAVTTRSSTDHIRVIDMTVGPPSVVGSLIDSANLDAPNRLAVVGDHAYVICDVSNTLTAISLVAPSAPTTVRTVGYSLAASDPIAGYGDNYVIFGQSATGQLRAIDVHTPSAAIHPYATLNVGGVDDLAIVGDLVVWVDGTNTLGVAQLGDFVP
jgi:hypothetical protein